MTAPTENEGVLADVRHRLTEVAKTLRGASGSNEAFAIDFSQLAHDIEALLCAQRPSPTVPETTQEYVDAFYQIAAMLDIGAKPYSPKEAFERDIKPKLAVLIAAAETTHGVVEGVRERAARLLAKAEAQAPSLRTQSTIVFLRDVLAALSADTEQVRREAGEEDVVTPETIEAAITADYENDLRDMTDKQIQNAIRDAQREIEEHEPWLEALVTRQSQRARLRTATEARPERQDEGGARG